MTVSVGELEDAGVQGRAPLQRGAQGGRLHRAARDGGRVHVEFHGTPAVRLLERLVTRAPRLIRRRFEYLRRSHNRAVSDQAMKQAALYARVVVPRSLSFLTRSNVMHRMLLKDRTVYE